MAIVGKIGTWGGARLLRRTGKALPWIGAVVALAAMADTMKRKGVIRGALDTGLNAVPFLGAAKGVAEIARGRDFIPDRGPRLR